ncbi:hypothetical protein [Actinoplanes regularis]|uniref:Uncharacterized protein n=1 Tax=Actinoplanes regularis TaxID=52697 RepID=A0A239KB77_9ACTN|nr:hypothetical protein [Actinoplanes regularis]SNT14923.1 hypothetical protein SAMN06264365_1467 [Actinoplanes regularis]
MNRLSGSELIVVVSDGSAVPAGTDLNPVLSEHARWLRSVGFDSVTEQLDPDALDQPADALGVVRAEVPIVYLVHTRADHAEQIRQALEDAGHAVVTDNDLRAVVTAARVLTELRRTGHPINQSAVVVAEPDELFQMAPLLIAIGFRNLVFWKQADATALPLARIAQDADIVVDLRAMPVDDPRTPGQTSPLVVRLPAPADCLAVLPGLLAAMVDTRTARLPIDVLAAVTQLLAIMTAPGFALATPDPTLTDGIAWVSRQALRHPRGG